MEGSPQIIDNPATIRKLREANDKIKELERAAVKEKAETLEEFTRLRAKHQKEIDFVKADSAIELRRNLHLHTDLAAERRDRAWDKKHDPEAWARRQIEDAERTARREQASARQWLDDDAIRHGWARP